MPYIKEKKTQLLETRRDTPYKCNAEKNKVDAKKQYSMIALVEVSKVGKISL